MLQVRTRNDDPKDIIYRAEAYDVSDFALPPPPPVDPAVAALSLAEYEALKRRMLTDTLKFAALGAVAAGFLTGYEQVSHEHTPSV
jgi:hypothetical protein